MVDLPQGDMVDLPQEFRRKPELNFAAVVMTGWNLVRCILACALDYL
ncbi:MAG: hypothetical protein ACR5K7_03625 [Symbiopectobacterium sp.]